MTSKFSEPRPARSTESIACTIPLVLIALLSDAVTKRKQLENG